MISYMVRNWCWEYIYEYLYLYADGHFPSCVAGVKNVYLCTIKYAIGTTPGTKLDETVQYFTSIVLYFLVAIIFATHTR